MAELLFPPNNPEKEQIVLRLMDDDSLSLTNWTQYSFESHFLNPADGFRFTIGDGNLSARIRASLAVGASVRLTVNDATLADGFIDSIEIMADRANGIVYEVCGRDRLGLVVDSIADPTKQFKEGMTLADAMKQLFTPFGWSTDDQFVIDNDANRDLRTGASRGTKTSKKGKPLKSVALHQLKPHNHEGVFSFASRICQRFGLWIWTYANGEKLVLGKPDFDQDPLFKLRRSATGGTNILSGTAHFSMLDQPTVIIADGYSGQAEFGNTRLKSVCVNPYFGVRDTGEDLPEVKQLLAAHPSAHRVEMIYDPAPQRPVGIPLRPLFLHDDESKTQEQLDNFVKREMSLLMRKSLTYHATVEGHGQLVNGEFSAWGCDCVVDVQDEVTGVHERMYILGCNYHKSRSGGTHTDLELIRLNSIQF